MDTALHPTDRTTLAEATADALRHDAARRAPTGGPRPRPRLLTGVALTTAVVALIVGAASPAVAEVTEAFDSYTGGDKVIHGLVDGWFEPDLPDPPAEPARPIGRVR